MANSDTETNTNTRKLTMAERAKIMRKEQYKKAKERHKAYLATPEVQKRLADQKERAKQLRKDKADQARERKKAENSAAKKSLCEDQKVAREEKQRVRDLELQQMVKPALTLIQGGVEG